MYVHGDQLVWARENRSSGGQATGKTWLSYSNFMEFAVASAEGHGGFPVTLFVQHVERDKWTKPLPLSSAAKEGQLTC